MVGRQCPAPYATGLGGPTRNRTGGDVFAGQLPRTETATHDDSVDLSVRYWRVLARATVAEKGVLPEETCARVRSLCDVSGSGVGPVDSHPHSGRSGLKA